jgi:hypothetical protein
MMTKTVIVKRDGAPGAFDECRRLLAACSLGSGGAYMADMIRKADGELDRLEAMVARDADVRTLDDWRKARHWRGVECITFSDVQETVRLWYGGRLAADEFTGSTPDEARAKAAAWVREQGK